MNREKLKKFLLIGLIMSSIMQVGILWDFSTHGLPSYFFRAFQDRVAPVSASIKKMKAELFSPKRIIVSTGASNWIVSKEGDTQDVYKALWDDAKDYISKIIAGEDIENVTMPDEKWSDIVLLKSIGIELDTPLSQDMIGYFLDSKVKNSSGAVFVKFVIAPWDSVNYNSTTVYLLDSNMHVYKYSLAMSQKNLKREFYDAELEKLNKLQDQEAIRNYMVFSESKIKLSYPIRQDMLVSAYGDKYDKLGQIDVTIPENFHIAPGSKLLDVESKLGGILGRDGDSYDIFTDAMGTVTMKNLNNQYRVYTDGVLEYKKTGNLTGDKGSKEQAFKNAMSFVEKLGLIPDNVQVYLSGIEETRDRFKFKFDYKAANVPIYFDIGLDGKNGDKIQNAIIIESNNDDALSCYWVVRNIELVKDKKKQYNVNFSDTLDKTFVEYPNIKQVKDFSIQDVLVGYRLTGENVGLKIEPMGLVMGGNNSIYSVKLPVKKGD